MGKDTILSEQIFELDNIYLLLEKLEENIKNIILT